MFNLTFVIVFSDGVKWIIRVPGRGVSSFGILETQKQLSDLETSSLIRSMTSIPTPKVFAWILGRNNLVGVHYHFEGSMEGKLLSERSVFVNRIEMDKNASKSNKFDGTAI